MAYFNKEMKKELSDLLKKEFGNSLKCSIKIEDYSGVQLTITGANVDLVDAQLSILERLVELYPDKIQNLRYEIDDLKNGRPYEINPFWVILNRRDKGKDEQVLKFWERFMDCVNFKNSFKPAERNGGNYPHFCYYVSIKIGSEKRPFKVI